jgi:hypothetical protein
MPSGPSVLVLPGTGKNFDQFRADDYDCRQFAQSQIGITPDNAAAESGVRSAALGTALGAVAGAAINGGHGAAVGAGTGLALGGLAGTGSGQVSAYSLQQRYDFGYQQCMYAKGHRVPVVAGSFGSQMAQQRPQPPRLAANPSVVPPPPPPGAPPPPPPR